MIYLPGLTLALAALWFALSGETSPLFLGFAGVSVLATLWLSARLEIIDRDASPYHRIVHLMAYSGWLAIEVLKSNVAVLVAILDPRPTIRPGLVKVEARGKSDLAKALFANSITLTPGTVTADMDRSVLLVHALREDRATAESFARMNRFAARAADGKD